MYQGIFVSILLSESCNTWDTAADETAEQPVDRRRARQRLWGQHPWWTDRYIRLTLQLLDKDKLITNVGWIWCKWCLFMRSMCLIQIAIGCEVYCTRVDSAISPSCSCLFFRPYASWTEWIVQECVVLVHSRRTDWPPKEIFLYSHHHQPNDKHLSPLQLWLELHTRSTTRLSQSPPTSWLLTLDAPPPFFFFFFFFPGCGASGACLWVARHQRSDTNRMTDWQTDWQTDVRWTWDAHSSIGYWKIKCDKMSRLFTIELLELRRLNN